MKVAILIPTIGRQDFIERTVSYYNSLNSPHPIYIGDASGSDAATRTINSLRQFKNVEVNYFHWEGFSRTPTLMRLAEIAGRENPFCVYSGDDDYFVPSSLVRCAKFLAENKDYRTAQGRAAVFMLDRPGAYGNIKILGGYWEVNALEQETSLERIEGFNKNYFVLVFSVHRTDEFLIDSECFFEVRDELVMGKSFFEVERSPFPELLHCYTFAARGKSKFVDCLFLIRNNHIDCVSGSPPLVDLILTPGWLSDLDKFLDALSLVLHETSGLSLSQSKKAIKRLIKNYLEFYSLHFYLANGSVSFLSLVKRLLPVGLKNILRQLSALAMGESDMRLLRSKRSRFYEDFLPVGNSLSKEESVQVEEQ